jgi:hypothetical protein
MKTKILTNRELPALLPHGWKKEVAGVLGVHYTTVSRALMSRSGDTYSRIMKVALEKWGVEKKY